MKHQRLLRQDIMESHVRQLERVLHAAKETQAALRSVLPAEDGPASAHKYDVKMVRALLRDGVVTVNGLRVALDEVERDANRTTGTGQAT